MQGVSGVQGIQGVQGVQGVQRDQGVQEALTKGFPTIVRSVDGIRYSSADHGGGGERGEGERGGGERGGRGGGGAFCQKLICKI